MRTTTSLHRRRSGLTRGSAALLLALAAGLASCGSDRPAADQPAGPPAAASTSAPGPAAAPVTVVPPPTSVAARPSGRRDELVTIRAGRLHLRCEGRGAATVVLLAGWGASDDGWGELAPRLARSARVCSYARFGTGTSDPSTRTQTFATQAADLYELLEAAGEPGPYVVAGHSFGGALAVTFASEHADEVVGLVLIDASPTTWPATVCAVPAYETACSMMRDPLLHPERLDVFRAFDAVARIGSLGDLPMTVLTAAHRTDPNLPVAELVRLDALWADGVRRWAALSTASRTVTVEGTGHDIHVDRPAVVAAEILRLAPTALDRPRAPTSGAEARTHGPVAPDRRVEAAALRSAP